MLNLKILVQNSDI